MSVEKRRIPLSAEILAGIHSGYARTAWAQLQRFEADCLPPPITEESDHNQFLWKKILWPGLKRFVAAKLDQNQYDARIRNLVAAIVTAALDEAPTFAAMARAMGKDRWNATDRKRLQRMVAEYLPDSITKREVFSPDGREQGFATAFDPLPGAAWPNSEHLPEPDLQRWATEPNRKFANIGDQMMVNAHLLACYPEYLRVWLLVQTEVNKLVAPYTQKGKTSATETLRHPVATSVLANHCIAICADSWWVKLSRATQAKVLATPREFSFSPIDVQDALRHWSSLVRLHEEWPIIAPHQIMGGAVALQRWDAPSEAGMLVEGASLLPGLADAQRGHLLANAGILFRAAGDQYNFRRALQEAIPSMNPNDAYLQVVARVNLGEAFGGPVAPEGRRQWASAQDRAKGNRTLEATLWRNVATACRRLNLPVFEEEALRALLDLSTSDSVEQDVQIHQRLTELGLENSMARPPKRDAFFGE